MRVKAAAHTGNGRTERKCGDLKGAHVDTYQVCRPFVALRCIDRYEENVRPAYDLREIRREA